MLLNSSSNLTKCVGMKDFFPFDNVRDKQEKLKEEVEKALEKRENVLTHAPTGLGKTAATVAPALSYALENDKTVFFITPRHSQHEIAVETLKKIREKHKVSFKAADIIGKRWMCEGGSTTFVEEGEDEKKCPRHDNTYKNNHELTDIAKKKLSEVSNEILRASELKSRCKKVCAYEISMHLASNADIIIGDYFHVFHPNVRDVIFSKSGLTLKDCIIIVDEGHNLPGRTRGLNSATITAQTVDKASKEAYSTNYHDISGKLDHLKKVLRQISANELGMEKETLIKKKHFMDKVNNFTDYKDLITDLRSVAKEILEENEESSCDAVANFMEKWTGPDKGFARIISRRTTSSNKEIIKIGYRCLNPQYATSSPLNNSHTSIVMSGTLKPLEMYMDILGLDESETRSFEFDSPFPKENKMNLIVDKVTTRYKERSDKEFQKIAWYVLKSAEEVKGNTGVFFPSYDFRDKILDILKDRIDQPIFVEKRGMNKEEKKKFLEKFGDKTDKSAVLFGVIGGSFGEGIDYPGDLMTAVFVVGVPLQNPDLEVKQLIKFYDRKFGNGWDYGYTYPAINRATQAAGRCIRSETDKGVVMYLDKRYSWRKYRKTLSSGDYHITQAPWNHIKNFFED